MSFQKKDKDSYTVIIFPISLNNNNSKKNYKLKIDSWLINYDSLLYAFYT